MMTLSSVLCLNVAVYALVSRVLSGPMDEIMCKGMGTMYVYVAPDLGLGVKVKPENGDQGMRSRVNLVTWVWGQVGTWVLTPRYGVINIYDMI